MVHSETVTYGMACVPFLAIRSLHFIAQRKQEQHPIGASVLLEMADSIEELQQKVHEVNKILAESGLSLAKLNASHLIKTKWEFYIKKNGDSVTKTPRHVLEATIGLFCFPPSGGEVTKRGLISILARLYVNIKIPRFVNYHLSNLDKSWVLRCVRTCKLYDTLFRVSYPIYKQL